MTKVREVSYMPKSVEKEPLLFVDTSYKGCFVQEQSFFKTPIPKPKDIVAANYVHNFDQLSESNFQSLVPSNITIHEVVEENQVNQPISDSFKDEIDKIKADSVSEPMSFTFDDEMDELEDSCPYETVNIVVDCESQPSSSLFEEEPIHPLVEAHLAVSSEEIPVVDELTIHEFELSSEEKTSPLIDPLSIKQRDDERRENDSLVVSANSEEDQVKLTDSFTDENKEVEREQIEGFEEFSLLESSDHDPLNEEEEITSVSVESAVELDEKQQEVLSFIRDLTNRPSMMRAPIVQIVKKDGNLKSGMIEVLDDWHISIDDLMDDVETISIADIEGIRILHL